MPTYDYECQKCSHTWEVFQPITAKPLRKCPECGKPSARRMIGAGAGIIFRGSGFYQTDYRSDSYKKAAAADKKSGEGTAKSDCGSGSDAKPAKKSEAAST
jgi:putative FmdB family regulatory protein